MVLGDHGYLFVLADALLLGSFSLVHLLVRVVVGLLALLVGSLLGCYHRGGEVDI